MSANLTRRSVSSGTHWEAMAGYARAVRIGDRILVSGTTATGPEGAVGLGDPAADPVVVGDAADHPAAAVEEDDQGEALLVGVEAERDRPVPARRLEVADGAEPRLRAEADRREGLGRLPAHLGQFADICRLQRDDRITVGIPQNRDLGR